MNRQIGLILGVGIVSASLAAGLVFAFKKAPNAPAVPQALAAPQEQEGPGEVQDVPKRPAEKPQRSPLTIPRNGGLWPWPIGLAPPEAPTLATSLTSIVHNKDPKGWKDRVKVHSASVNPSVGKAVVTASGFDPQNRPKSNPGWGEVYLCDLTSGQVTHRWETKKAMYPFDVHRDGNRFLLRVGHSGYDLDTQIVELWEVGPGDKVRRRTWRPYFERGGRKSSVLEVNEDSKLHIPEAQVKWAAFVGPDHIVTLHAEVLKIWDRMLQLLGTFQGVTGLPAVSPDGNKLAFIHKDSVALLDPATLSIVSARPIGEPPTNPVLSFQPGGEKLAVIGSGRTAVLDLKSGKVWNAMLADLKHESKGDWAELPPAYGWAGDRYIFFAGQLYDLDMPVPVWRYHWAAWSNIQGRSAWAVADNPQDKQVVLRSFKIPHATMQATLHKLLLTSDIFDLRPRDGVRVDVAGLPADQQERIRKSLEKRLQELGYVLDPTAKVTFKASQDPPVQASVTYDGQKYPYTATVARLTAERSGRQIWKTSGCHYPPILISYTGSLADAVRRYGGADYAIYTDHPLPGVIRKDNRKGALGTSSFRVNGIEEKN